MENSDFVSSAELTEYAEKAFQEFIGIMLTKEPDLMTVKLNGNALPGTGPEQTELFNLPSDFKALRRIRHKNGFSLRKAELAEVEALSFNGRRGKPTHYWLTGTHNNLARLVFLPDPDTTYEVRLYYIPSVSLADVSSGGLNLIAGWDEYVVITTAMKMKDKEESDVSVLMAERKMLLEHIIAQVTAQDTGEPGRMTTFSPNPFYNDPYSNEEGWWP